MPGRPLSRHRRVLVTSVILFGTIAACSSDGPDHVGRTATAESGRPTTAPEVQPETIVGHTDIRPDGNRYLDGARDIFTEAPVTIDLGFEPVWVIPIDPDSATGGGTWVVVGADGTVAIVDAVDDRGIVRSAGRADPAAVPVAVRSGDDLTVGEARHLLDAEFEDARPITLADGTSVHLDGPTDRYPHGVLGTDVEAEQLVIDGEVVVDLDRDVFEAVTPMAADLDGDGTVEIVVTQSNATDGATVVAYDLDGREFARTEPIGQGNRWRHQVAVAPTGLGGEVELVEVRTPHIGGIVTFHQLRDGRLSQVARLNGYGSHVYGSANLALAVVFDADGDGSPELVVPTQRRDHVALIGRTDDGAVEEARLTLPAPLSTNLAATVGTDQRVKVAAGTADGTLLLWP